MLYMNGKTTNNDELLRESTTTGHSTLADNFTGGSMNVENSFTNELCNKMMIKRSHHTSNMLQHYRVKLQSSKINLITEYND